MDELMYTIFSQGGVLACPELKELKDIDNAIITMTFENGALGMIDLTEMACTVMIFVLRSSGLQERLRWDISVKRPSN